jgi:hypothetical protein
MSEKEFLTKEEEEEIANTFNMLGKFIIEHPDKAKDLLTLLFDDELDEEDLKELEEIAELDAISKLYEERVEGSTEEDWCDVEELEKIMLDNE